jgi:UDP-N-acetylmuramoylalanine--D-glutamate ligase
MIDLSSYKGRTLAVLGLGKSGLSAARTLSEAGAQILAWDDSEDTRQASGLPLTDLTRHDFAGVDALVISPGIPHTYPEPHPVAAKAKAANVPLICDVELLCRACPEAEYIAITGTNGKSTTTALIAHILREFRPAEAGGNIGRPVMTLPALGQEGTYVLEMSSYQLELTPSLSPAGAVFLNITPDHIERHGDLNGYIAAKKNIFANPSIGSVAVIGIDTEASRKVADELGDEWNVVRISTQAKIDIYVEDGILHDGDTKIDLKAMPTLKGQHNHENAACAYAVINRVYGIEAEAIAAAMKTFPGLPHRQFPVRTLDGVTYINDSKATNADAAARALACYDDIYWIIGGLPKEGGLAGLEIYKDRIRHTFLIGKAAPEFAKWLDQQNMPYTQCGTLEKAVAAAHAMAKSGTVLLSPACASWDQFKSFEHRGDVFAELVRAL